MTKSNTRSVCIIGAGTMGSGIAAHLANVGFDVTLLDITSAVAAEGLERAKKAKPPHFYDLEIASKIRLGGLDKDLDMIAGADWVCEAIIEDFEAKKALFQQIEPLLKDDALLSTNTSGLQISLLADALSERFQHLFVGTHFFNPPRYLKLLELIPTDKCSPEHVAKVKSFLEHAVGRRVVLAKDTPGFIANRFGMFSIFHAIHTAERMQLTIQQADLITGQFLGRPRSGTFRLADLIGLDVMASIASNIRERCAGDPGVAHLALPHSMSALLDRGWIGEKAGQGYYRKEGREPVGLDLQNLIYREPQGIELPSIQTLGAKPMAERLPLALAARDDVGEFLRRHLVPVLQYANAIKEEVSYSVEEFDRVLRWGFGWQYGPFEMIDMIGPERLGVGSKHFYTNGSFLSYSGEYEPRKHEPQFNSIHDYKVLTSHETFNVRDLGENVLGISLKTKMGVITPLLVSELSEWLSNNARHPIVLASESRSFSVGFDLRYFLEAVDHDRWIEIDETLMGLQQLAVRLGKQRSVAAVQGHCLGGGFELATSCSNMVIHPEAQMGLPEAKVGVVPAGSGTMRMRTRHQESVKTLTDVAQMLALGQISTCAADARRLGYLRPQDQIVINPDMLIAEAIQAAKEAQVQPAEEWKELDGPLLGMIDRQMAELHLRGEMSQYDLVIADSIKDILARSHSADEALDRERAEFIDLLKHPSTQARIRAMLETGKPLRN